MSEISGMIKPNIQELPNITDRMTFLYLEHCKINRQDSAITVLDEKGITHIPSGMIAVLLLGPGTEITHRAIELIGDSGINICWIGEKGVRYYASGHSLTNKSKLILKQAELVTNQRTHLDVARKMYCMRFKNEDVSKLSMQQLRGKEGSRMNKLYKELSKKWGVTWNGRNYDYNDFSSSDPINKALSAGNVCLYGLASSVIFSIGCSPALGFVHVGNEFSFAYDIADLYKAETTIPIAFEVVASNTNDDDISTVVRHKVRDKFVEINLLERMVKDIKYLLNLNNDINKEANVMYLWDNKLGQVDYGKQYSFGD